MLSCNTVGLTTQFLLGCGLLVLVSTSPAIPENLTKGYLEDSQPADDNQIVRPSPRIVGGNYAAEGQFPHQVALYILDNFNCGGSIISANYVLTAAHCVTSRPGNNYPAFFFTVRAGSTRANTGGVLVDVAEIKVHPQYREFINDVALLRLSSKLTLSNGIKAIPLASADPPSGSAITISGWGRERTEGAVSVRLKYNILFSLSNDQCNRVVRGIDPTTLCLSHSAGNGACSGDSGGPGVYNGELVGVSNYVINGCGSRYPDGYAKVSSFRNWIRQNSDLS